MWCANSAQATAQFGPIENWDVSAVGSFENLFEDCASSNFVDLRRWDTRLVTSMQVPNKATPHVCEPAHRLLAFVCCR